ncbi:MAG: hypothetical protein HY053_08805 [Proteobacteria bacterium]|nr:hypothetical protein [Pseudomonadota bacterium]
MSCQHTDPSQNLHAPRSFYTVTAVAGAERPEEAEESAKMAVMLGGENPRLSKCFVLKQDQ